MRKRPRYADRHRTDKDPNIPLGRLALVLNGRGQCTFWQSGVVDLILRRNFKVEPTGLHEPGCKHSFPPLSGLPSRQ